MVVLASMPISSLMPSDSRVWISFHRTRGLSTTPGPMSSFLPKMAPLGTRSLVLLSAYNYGMAGVVAALEANHNIVIFGQQVNNLAFAFITKLRTGEYRKHEPQVSCHIDNNFDAHSSAMASITSTPRASRMPFPEGVSSTLISEPHYVVSKGSTPRSRPAPGFQDASEHYSCQISPFSFPVRFSFSALSMRAASSDLRAAGDHSRNCFHGRENFQGMLGKIGLRHSPTAEGMVGPSCLWRSSSILV